MLAIAKGLIILGHFLCIFLPPEFNVTSGHPRTHQGIPVNEEGLREIRFDTNDLNNNKQRSVNANNQCIMQRVPGDGYRGSLHYSQIAAGDQMADYSHNDRRQF